MDIASLINNIYQSGFQVYIEWGKELCIYLKINDGNEFFTVFQKFYDPNKYDQFDNFLENSLITFKDWFEINKDKELESIINYPSHKNINEYKNWIF